MNWIRQQIRLYFLLRALRDAKMEWDRIARPMPLSLWIAHRNRYGRILHLIDKARYKGI